MLTIGATAFAQFFLLTLYLQQVLRYSAIQTGVAFIAITVTIVVVSSLGQALTTRLGARPVLTAGLLLTAAGGALYAQMPADGHYFSDVFPGLILSGIGLALSFVPVTIAGLTGVQPADAGVASGLINTSRQVGGSVGLAAVTTIAATATSHYAHSNAVLASSGPALTHGFQVAFYTLTGVALAGAAIAAAFIESKQRSSARASRSRPRSRSGRQRDRVTVPSAPPVRRSSEPATHGGQSCTHGSTTRHSPCPAPCSRCRRSARGHAGRHPRDDAVPRRAAREPDQRLRRLRRHPLPRAQARGRARRAHQHGRRLARRLVLQRAERAALALTEAATRLADRPDPVPDDVWDEAARHYDEAQLAALVLAIAAINTWNRLNVTTRQISGDWVGQWVAASQKDSAAA